MSILGMSELWKVIADISDVTVESIRRWWKRKDSREVERRRLKDELAKAIKEGRMTDAGFLKDALERLGCFILCLFIIGCRTDKPIKPPVYGERIFIKQAGETWTFPELVPPAKMWYVTDDVGLKGWLGLMSTMETSTMDAHVLHLSTNACSNPVQEK